MSIYATLWQIRLPVPEWDVLLATEHGEFRLEEGELVPHEESWIKITFQGVPGHMAIRAITPMGTRTHRSSRPWLTTRRSCGPWSSCRRAARKKMCSAISIHF